MPKFSPEPSAKSLLYYMSLDPTKPVFGVSGKARLKPISSATEASKKIEVLLVARLDMVLSKKTYNKGADRSAGMHRLVCTFVVRKSPEDRFSHVEAHIILIHSAILGLFLG